VSEKLVAALFRLARRLEPCVVFIDEIDALFAGRGKSGSTWHTSMLTEFMQEMDGLLVSNVIVIGATNRPYDLDDAVLRRLPCRLLVDLPNQQAREAILKIMVRDEELAPEVDLGVLAEKTVGYSGSDLKRASVMFIHACCGFTNRFCLDLCVAAALEAVKETVRLPWKTNDSSKDSDSTVFDNVHTDTTTLHDVNMAIEEFSRESTGDSPDTTDTTSASGSIGTTPTPTATSDVISPSSSSAEAAPAPARVLYDRHFSHALLQVAPSSSESQDSLKHLRRWNTVFGTGGRK
jgi:SpoVK/Ycf46/Vps4 family AAA+-type ATPase